MKKYIVTILLAFCLKAALAITLVANNPSLFLTGSLQENFTALSGHTSGVIVNLGSGPVPTGEISFVLDTRAPSFFFFDFENATGTVHLALLTTFPLQQALGAPPVPIEINETGSITRVLQVTGPSLIDVQWSAAFIGAINGAEPTSGSLLATSLQPVSVVDTFATFQIEATLTGGGSVNEGLFTGFTFFNDNIYNIANNNKGIGNGGTSRTPEPPTLGLCLMGAVILWVHRKRRHRLNK